jgi:DNA-binding NtrC family response regulator
MPIHLPVEQPPATAGTVRSLDDIERETILAALTRNNGNRAATAAALGISVRKLYYRLVEYQKQGYVS